MTEDEWNASTDPQTMLEFLRGKASDRKLRLFAVACCRRLWPLIDRERCRKMVDVAERFAEGQCGKADLKREREALSVLGSPVRSAAHSTTRNNAFAGAHDVVQMICPVVPGEAAEQVRVLCCIFGNHFRPIGIDLSWTTNAVVRLAQAIYEERAFDRLPILADALEDAGCTDPDILAHCRGPVPHARGCWAIDLVLAKE